MGLLGWENVPEPILLRILGYLSITDITQSALTCQRWCEISQDNSLWRGLLRRKYKVAKLQNLKSRCPGLAWKEEYRRLTYLTPAVCSQRLVKHTDEVLHVSFSNSGENFVTCSKDATFIIWRMTGSFFAEIDHQEDMRRFHWRYTWSSKYNKTDNLLLVAGAISDINGEISVFSKSESQPTYRIVCRVANNPYDVMGDWASEFHFFSGRLIMEEGRDWPSATLFMCEANAAEQNTSSPAASNVIKNVILRFSDDRINYLRCLHVTDRNQFKDHGVFTNNSRTRDEIGEQFADEACLNVLKQKQTCLIFLTTSESMAPHQLGFCLIKPEDLSRISFVRHPDKVIDMHGHIVGLSLSPDKRFLYINVRRWPSNSALSLFESPAIACEIEMRVVDLETLELLDTVYVGHKGFTDSYAAFYIYIDVSEDLIASGSEDKKGRIWDRHYGCKVSELLHDECVNAVAFSPSSQQVAVSVSDDKSVKIWKSRALMKTEIPRNTLELS